MAQANAYHYWWLLGNSGSTDNQALTDGFGNPAKRLYAFGQFSRFVRPDSNRIGVSNIFGALISAYKHPTNSNFAIVAINTSVSPSNVLFNLNGFPTVASVRPWITSAGFSLAAQPALTVSNASFTYALPAQSIVTFVGQGVARPVLNSITLAADRVYLSGTGSLGPNYTLLVSSNLSNWQVLFTTNPSAMPVQFTDTNRTAPARFYRLQIEP